VGCIVVVEQGDGGRLPIGILTDRDIVMAVVAKDADAKTLRAGDVMTATVASVRESDTLYDVLSTMRSRGVRRVPVTGPHGTLAGILTLDDVLNALARRMPTVAHRKTAAGPSDVALATVAIGDVIIVLPHEIGPLFCEGGGRDVLFFVDHQPYDCSPLPEPVDCPAAGALELCGDACGPCQEPTDVCYGRSPRHPHSFCIPKANGPSCSSTKPCAYESRACFHFVHEGDPVAQALADEFGICLERSVCEAAAAEIPGGGRCEG
jgi:CBS domain-containing protein